MRLQDIMRRPVRTIERKGTAREARGLMRLYRVRHLAVLEGQRLVGILSEGDLGGPRRENSPPETPVEELMTEHPVVAGPDTTVRQAANLLRGHKIGCLPVIEAGRLSGIVTATDLLALIGRGVEAPSPNKKRAVLARRGPRKKRGAST